MAYEVPPLEDNGFYSVTNLSSLYLLKDHKIFLQEILSNFYLQCSFKILGFCIQQWVVNLRTLLVYSDFLEVISCFIINIHIQNQNTTNKDTF